MGSKGRKNRASMGNDKCFQILKMMTEKLHGSLGAVSNNVMKLCNLLGVQVQYLQPSKSSENENNGNNDEKKSHKSSVSHEILDLFQWSTTIEQELAHLATTLSLTRHSSGTWPMERKISKYIIHSNEAPSINKEEEANKRKTLALAKLWLDDFLESFVIPTEKAANSNTSAQYNPHSSPQSNLQSKAQSETQPTPCSPSSSYGSQSTHVSRPPSSSHHHHSHSHPHLHHIHYPVHGHNYSSVNFHHSHRVHRSDNPSSNFNKQASDTEYLNKLNIPTSTYNSNDESADDMYYKRKQGKSTKGSKSPRKASNSPKRVLADRITDRFSFRKRVTPDSKTSCIPSPPISPTLLSPRLDCGVVTLCDPSSCSESEQTAMQLPPSPSIPISPGMSTTPAAPFFFSNNYDTGHDSDSQVGATTHGFSSDDEAVPSNFRSQSVRRRSCFESEGEREGRDSEGKEKGLIGSWRLWARSTGNSTDEEIASPGRRRSLAKKSKFRLRLFESKD